jgi:hypothetical protein
LDILFSCIGSGELYIRKKEKLIDEYGEKYGNRY